MTEVETGEFAHPFEEIVDAAVRFDGDIGKDDALVTFKVGTRERWANEYIFLEVSLSTPGTTPEEAITGLGLNRILSMIAAAPRSFSTNESRFRPLLAEMARDEVISPAVGLTPGHERRNQLLETFATQLLARPPSAPIDPSPGRRI
jgi:hypothetical protein